MILQTRQIQGYSTPVHASGPSIADFDDVAVGIGEISIGRARGVFAALNQLSAGLLDLRDTFLEGTAHGEAEMRHAAMADRLSPARFVERDDILGARRA